MPLEESLSESSGLDTQIKLMIQIIGTPLPQSSRFALVNRIGPQQSCLALSLRLAP